MRTVSCCVMVALLLAQRESRGAGPDEARAKALFDQGEAAWKSGDYERAQDLFSQSYQAGPRVSTLANLGLAEEKLGHPLEALRDFRKAAAWPDLDAKQRALIEGYVRRTVAQTGHLSVHASVGSTVSVDGVLVEHTDDPLDVLVGHHVAEAKVEDRRTLQEVDAPAGSVVDVTLTVPPRGSVVSSPAPIAPPAPPSAASPPSTVPPPSGTWWRGPQIAGVTLGALAVGAGAAGLGFLIASENFSGEVNNLRGNLSNGQCGPPVGNASCDGLTRKLDAEHTDKVAADVSVALAGAFLVTSVGAFVLGAQAPARGSATIVPVLGPTTLGVAGRF